MNNVGIHKDTFVRTKKAIRVTIFDRYNNPSELLVSKGELFQTVEYRPRFMTEVNTWDGKRKIHVILPTEFLEVSINDNFEDFYIPYNNNKSVKL